MESELIKKVLDGDVRTAAKLIRGIEDELADAFEALESVYLHTGRAYIVGVAGAPGAGKSTLLGNLIGVFRRRDMKVGVVAIDPTSPFSGGALLGDRLRMQTYGTDGDVFIRSLATRGWKGGLAKATVNTVHVMDAMGKDIIFVEAVGSGQGEVDIAKVADTSIIVLTPGMGDEVQMMKAGILEAADIFVINKADREGAASVRSALELMLKMKTGRPGDWQPCIVLTEAIYDTGTEQLAEGILKHKEFLVSSGQMEKRRRVRAELELVWAVESSLRNYLESMDKDYLTRMIDDLVQRKISPQSAAALIVNIAENRER